MYVHSCASLFKYQSCFCACEPFQIGFDPVLQLNCPSLARYVSAPLQLDLGYLGYRQCQCAATLRFDIDAYTCIKCSPRIVCNQSLQAPLHQAQAGFYPIYSTAR